MKHTQEYQQGHATGYSKGYRTGLQKGLGTSKSVLLSYRQTLMNRLSEITAEVEAMNHDERVEYWNRFFRIESDNPLRETSNKLG